MRTCATPLIMDMRGAISVSAYASSALSVRVFDITTRRRTGSSLELVLTNEGGLGIPGGSKGPAWVMAACTSCAAASILRLRSNCMMIRVEPNPLLEVIESRPLMVENCRSKGVATAEDIVSELAPGRLADTLIVG